MWKQYVGSFLAALALSLVLSAGLPALADAAQKAKGAKHAEQSSSPSAVVTNSDNQLADAVRQALQQAGFANESVMVEAKDGTIKLTGSVLGKDRIDECERVVRRVDGVKRVENELTFPSVQTGGDR